MPASPPTLGLILAGGLARRMGGGDKALAVLAGRSLLDRVVARFGPQCAELALSANGDPDRFAGAGLAAGLAVLPDGVPGHPGPLAGVLAGLERARARGFAWVASAPSDAPFLPDDLVARLHAARLAAGAAMALAESGGRAHPVAALWPVALVDDLCRALEAGERRVGLFAARHGAARAAWGPEPVDPFLNLNTPADLAEAERLIARYGEV
jgi:molybdenum cofactor guanylyltransferase